MSEECDAEFGQKGYSEGGNASAQVSGNASVDRLEIECDVCRCIVITADDSNSDSEGIVEYADNTGDEVHDNNHDYKLTRHIGTYETLELANDAAISLFEDGYRKCLCFQAKSDEVSISGCT